MVTLAEEEPFAAVVDEEFLASTCSSCFTMKEDGAMSRCNTCRLIHYCSRECQKNDWVNHKMECSLLEKWYPNKPPTECRLIARIVFKLARSDAQDAAFNGRRFEDLMDHYEEIRKDPSRSQFFAFLANGVNVYMGAKYSPTRDVLLSVYGKCLTNCFSIYMDLRKIGRGLYIGISAQNHSCIPDAHVIFEGSTAILRSPDKAKTYSKDITVSYADLLFSSEVRKATLLAGYYFDCTCPLCSDPQSDFIYNSAYSTCCVDSYCLLDPNASELKCFKCGTPSKITVKEAIAANEEISILNKKLDDEKASISDMAAHFQSVLKKFEKFSKILSPLNVNLLRVTDNLLGSAIVLDDYPACQKYIQTILPGYRLYLKIGSPSLSDALRHFSYVLTAAPTATKKGLEVIEEALAALTVSHGPDHAYTKLIDRTVLVYRMRLMGAGMVTLADEIPFAAVVADDHLAIACSSCFSSKEDRAISRCTRCRVVHYCSKECQKNDWTNHKYECLLLENCSPRIPSSMCRLIARIAFKLDRPKGQEAAFNGRVYEELMDHREEIQKDPERADFFVTVSHVLYEYMGEKFVPKPATLMSIFGKIITNCFTICDENNDIGQGLYIGLSAHDHSCTPDAFIHFDGIKAILRSPNPNKKYSKDLTISYTDLLQSNRDRIEKLRSMYYFTCNCSICSDPTKDFLYNSARSACCPESYCLLDPGANEISCFKCGAVSKIDVDEAIAANQEISFLWEKLTKERKSDSDRTMQLQSLIRSYQKFAKILSPLNVNLLRIADKLFNTALELENRPVCRQYAPSFLAAYKRYLPVGHPALATRLLYAAMAMSFDVTPTGRVLEQFEEALAASLVSHGPRHRLTSTIDHMLSTYRIRLQRDTSS